jgi:hypothetical protein
MIKEVEKDQKLYVDVSSVTVTPEETIYFLEGGNIASDFWLNTRDLRLISRPGQPKTLRFTGICESYQTSTQSMVADAVGQEIDVTVEIVTDFPQP